MIGETRGRAKLRTGGGGIGDASFGIGDVLVTHDVSTMTAHAIHRIENGLPMPGVIECPRTVAIGAAIDDLLLIAECSIEGEWRNQILYLPL